MTVKLIRRAGVIAGTALAVVLTVSTPALAHVEVSADKPQAGATGVTVTFNAEAESDAAGAKQLEVQLPAGIAPADVSYVSGPAGWAFTATANGYTVAGAALKVHQDVGYAVKVAKLPADATSLVFKTIVTYGNNAADRWIEIQQPGQAEPPHPAPVLQLQPAATPTGQPSPSALPATGVTAAVSASATPAAAAGRSGSTGAWWLAALVVILLAAGASAWLVRRRRGTPTR